MKAQTFEHIAHMTEEFHNAEEQELTPEGASYWQLRILLSIAQQLSVIAGHLKGES